MNGDSSGALAGTAGLKYLVDMGVVAAAAAVVAAVVVVVVEIKEEDCVLALADLIRANRYGGGATSGINHGGGPFRCRSGSDGLEPDFRPDTSTAGQHKATQIRGERIPPRKACLESSRAELVGARSVC